MRTRIGTLVIFAALAAALSSARPLVAAGTIQSVSAVPSPAAPNQDVTLTLRGVGGPCRATLFFGDGTYVPLVVSGFPTASKHRYPAAGMFFVRALGRAEFVAGESTGTAPPPCVGGGELPLSVLATGPAPSGGGTSGGGTSGGGTSGGGTSGGGTSGGGTGGGTPGGGTPGGGSPGGSGGASSGASAFAAAPAKGRSVVPTRTPTPSAVSFGGNTLASPNSNMGAVSPDFTSHAFQTLQNPTIKKVTDDSQPTPGGVIGVEGAGFGTWIVNRRMILKTGGKQVDLQIVNWGDNAAAGTVPDDFEGVPDGAATIQLVNGIKRPTNEMPLSFTAARETVEIIKRPVGIRGCYSGGMAFTCNGVDSDNSGGVQDLDSAPSVYVYHGCTHWDLFHTGDDGHDTFEVQLKNGWIFEDAKVERICGFGDMNYSGCYLIDNLAATVVGRGKPIGSISTSWHVPRLYAGIYDVHIYATGPAGVPYQ